MRRSIALWAVGCTILFALPASAAPPEHDLAFPPAWTVEDIDEPLGAGPAQTVLHAYPEDRSEECRLVDLAAVGGALAELGVKGPDALNQIAKDLLGRGEAFARSSGLGYGAPWSVYVEGSPEDGPAFVLYSFLGRDAWPGLEDAWLVLECWSDAQFHQDWAQIARTFEWAIPAAALESTGPVVIDGRLDLPSLGLALDVPEGWMGADLTDADLVPTLGQYGSEGDWFALQFEHDLGESIATQAEDGMEVVAWAWNTDHEGSWPEHCELLIEEPTWDSATELVEMAGQYASDDEGLRDSHTWSMIELPAGEAARHDYRWTAQSGGTDFILISPEREITLACQDYGFGTEADVAVKRHRWRLIAETIQPLP